MQRTPEQQSDEASDQPESDFVYDFLYHDARRIASFLAQLDPNGYLQALKHSLTSSDTQSSKHSAGGGVNLPTIFRADASRENQAGTVSGEASERTYDPLWANALAFLDYLEQRGLIQRDVRQARIGQFVLARGSLAIWDFSILKSLWDSPNVRGLAGGNKPAEAQDPPPQPALSNRQARRHPPPQPAPVTPAGPDASQVGLDMLRVMPHGIQARLQVGPSTTIWAGLQGENLTVASSDLFLKHGQVIAGRWAVLGILDALPGELVDDDDPEVQALVRDFAGTPLGQIMGALGIVTKIGLGRPPTAYGMTPLVIFREVAKEQSVGGVLKMSGSLSVERLPSPAE